MLRVLFLATLLAGCASTEVPPSVFMGRPLDDFDSGPPRVCGVVEGSKCEGNGEITRCLCSSFEEQKGIFVCCVDGVAQAKACVQAHSAFDCDGKPAIAAMDAGPSD